MPLSDWRKCRVWEWIQRTRSSPKSVPSIATAYDFSVWEKLTDVGGGNGIVLSHIVEAHKTIRGILADVPHVLDRARERGLLSGELATRTSLQTCNFFEAIPAGSRAYLMKSVIHDWDDNEALQILRNCRKVVPENGALLLLEMGLSGPNQPSIGKAMDLFMLVLTGGLERTVDEYRDLLARAGFRLNGAVPTGTEFILVKHALRNSSSVPVSVVVVTTSKLYEFFGEVSKPFDPKRRPAPPTPEEKRAFFDAVARYGYWMASPEENAAIGIRSPEI